MSAYSWHPSQHVKIGTLSYKKALELMNDNNQSYLDVVTAEEHILLSPKHLGRLKEGVTAQLDSKLHVVSSKLNGALIAYNNIQLKSSQGVIRDENSHIHFDVKADFIVFRPVVGGILTGVVNRVFKHHVNCLVHNCFNASIHKPRNVTGDWAGSSLTVGQDVTFRVLKVYSYNGVMSLRGDLTDDRPASKSAKIVKKKTQNGNKDTKKSGSCDSIDSAYQTDSTVTNSSMDEDMQSPVTRKPKKDKTKMRVNVVGLGSELGCANDSEVGNNSIPDRDEGRLSGAEHEMNLSKNKKKKKRKESRTENESCVDGECLMNIQDQSVINSSSERTKKHKKRKSDPMGVDSMPSFDDEGSGVLSESEILMKDLGLESEGGLGGSQEKRKRKLEDREGQIVVKAEVPPAEEDSVVVHSHKKKKKRRIKQEELDEEYTVDQVVNTDSVANGEEELLAADDSLTSTSKKKKKKKRRRDFEDTECEVSSSRVKMEPLDQA